MSPIHAIGVGIALIGVYFMASSVTALLLPTGGLYASLIVGALLFAFALIVVGKKRD